MSHAQKPPEIGAGWLLWILVAFIIAAAMSISVSEISKLISK